MSARRAQQSGWALIALMSMIAMGASYLFVSRLNAVSGDFVAVTRLQNAAILKQAKQALIGHVALQAAKASEDNPGRLACPESAGNIGGTNEGATAGNCTLPAIGRFPWRTFGTEKLVDASGEPLWYVVSPGWALSNSTTPALTTYINSNSLGQLLSNPRMVSSITRSGTVATVTSSAHGFRIGDAVKVTGASPTGYNISAYITGVPSSDTFTYTVDSSLATPAAGTIKAGDAAVALIIAPGAAMSVAASANCTARAQARSVPAPTISALDYLECYDAANGVFSTTGPASSFNDQVVAITAAELLPAIEAAVADRFQHEIAPLIAAVYSGGSWSATTVLPFAAPFGNPTTSNFSGGAILGSGTVSVTNGNPAATLSSSVAYSLTGRYLQVVGTNAVLVAAHTAGTANLTLESAYTGVTDAAAAYQIIVAQGLLPLTYAETSPGSGTACTVDAVNAPRCDPTLVAWTSTSTITSAYPVPVPSPTNCTVTSAAINCTVYAWAFGSTSLPFTLQATASNVGMALRQFNTAVTMTGIDAAGRGASGILNTTGTATVTFTGTAPVVATVPDGTCGLSGFMALFFDCYQYDISVPILLLADHSLLDASTASIYGWFLRNKWHEVAYYAVAPGIAPSGARSCTSSSTCLNVTYHPSDGKQRGLIVIGGRPFGGQTRPAAAIADLLEAPNIDGNTTFAIRSPTLLVNQTFNDRVAVISSNP